ncbi:MAG: acyl-CoA dehydrogenase family protein [Deltaproteobacteria bacterium]|nr:acyl-CoA dehydrogenase family protein [Deltaproteobacteria bacterium]
MQGAEHEALRAIAARFAAEHIAPHALDWEETGFPRDLPSKLAEAGLLGVGYPEAVGGMAATSRTSSSSRRSASYARLYPIGGGTREIMNEIVAKLAGWVRLTRAAGCGRIMLRCGQESPWGGASGFAS